MSDNLTSKQNLLPCPFCGHDDVVLRKMRTSIFIDCDSCNASGPTYETIDACVRGWNAVPRTAEPPEDGLRTALRGLLEIEDARISIGAFYPNAEAQRRIDAARAALTKTASDQHTDSLIEKLESVVAGETSAGCAFCKSLKPNINKPGYSVPCPECGRQL